MEVLLWCASCFQSSTPRIWGYWMGSMYFLRWKNAGSFQTAGVRCLGELLLLDPLLEQGELCIGECGESHDGEGELDECTEFTHCEPVYRQILECFE